MSVVPKNDLKTEKTRSDGEASKRANRELKDTTNINQSLIHNNINNAECSSVISEYLNHGSENAISAKDLQKFLNCDDRSLRHIVTAERDNGILILSNTKGYFLPDSGEKGRAELDQFVKFMQARTASTFRAIYHAKKELEHLDGQGVIEEMR